MDSLGQSEVRVQCVISDELLLVPHVRGVNAGVRIVLAKYRYARLERKRGRCAYDTGIRRCRAKDRALLANAGNLKEACTRRNFLLLDAVRSNGANLGEHVLARVENAVARTKCGFAVAADVPSETHTRLEFLIF